MISTINAFVQSGPMQKTTQMIGLHLIQCFKIFILYSGVPILFTFFVHQFFEKCKQNWNGELNWNGK